MSHFNTAHHLLPWCTHLLRHPSHLLTSQEGCSRHSVYLLPPYCCCFSLCHQDRLLSLQEGSCHVCERADVTGTVCCSSEALCCARMGQHH